jgi:hypothetical protein
MAAPGGPLQLNCVPAVRNIPKLNGIIGNPLLSRYHVFFDYHRGRLIVENSTSPP